jgi:hypothetical protein
MLLMLSLIIVTLTTPNWTTPTLTTPRLSSLTLTKSMLSSPTVTLTRLAIGSKFYKTFFFVSDEDDK